MKNSCLDLSVRVSAILERIRYALMREACRSSISDLYVVSRAHNNSSKHEEPKVRVLSCLENLPSDTHRFLIRK